MSEQCPYDGSLSRNAKRQVVLRPLADRSRVDGLRTALQPSTFNLQPAAGPPCQERRLLSLRFEDGPYLRLLGAVALQQPTKDRLMSAGRVRTAVFWIGRRKAFVLSSAVFVDPIP